MFIKCYICQQQTPKGMTHEHHLVPKAFGGTDAKSNLVRICNGCHGNIHTVAYMFANPGRVAQINDSLVTIYGTNREAIGRCIQCAKTVYQEMLHHKEMKKELDDFEEPMPIFTLPLKLKRALSMLGGERRNAKGRRLGITNYMKMIIVDHIGRMYPELKLYADNYKSKIMYEDLYKELKDKNKKGKPDFDTLLEG